jgi:hypothetical protein
MSCIPLVSIYTFTVKRKLNLLAQIKKNVLFCILLFWGVNSLCVSQNFVRTELTTTLSVPWEIIYGPDHFL